MMSLLVCSTSMISWPRSEYLNDQMSPVFNYDGDLLRRKLNALNLPASLDALSQPVGLPPSLLQQAEQVRSENGPDRVMKMLEDSPMLANRCRDIIEEVS